MLLNIPSPFQKINHSLFRDRGIEVFVKRDDLIDKEVSGNKWRKLKYNIEKYKAGKYDSILTFGGAFSNHIAATAAAGRMLNIPTIGIIRGDELNTCSNKTLRLATVNKMKLVFVSREIYKQRNEQIYHEELRNKFGNTLLIEEGGAGQLGVLGATEIMNELPFQPDHLYVAAGTGTTAAGLLFSSNKTQINAVSVLKGGKFLNKEIERLLYLASLTIELANQKMNYLTLNTETHFGGYAKQTTALTQFMNDWYSEHQIQLDPIYTAKMAFAFMSDLHLNKFSTGQKIVLLHTGGLQGIAD